MFSFVPKDGDWGFYAHRLLNELAVYTLPQDLVSFYKENIDFISEHAVDPDKRRYASSFEAVRHYIDIDHWGEYPFHNLPRDWYSAVCKQTKIVGLLDLDTITVLDMDVMKPLSDSIELNFICQQHESHIYTLPFREYRDYFVKHIIPQYYEKTWSIQQSAMIKDLNLSIQCDNNVTLLWLDRLSEYGVLPWHLQYMQYRLTQAFRKRDKELVLRLSAEMGHYIGDAHVPLHTTTNYNGQLTDQVGIHAFWESRIPELFAEKEYDFFVGKAEYIENTREYFWKIVLKSHSYVDSVLTIEKRLKEEWSEDKIYCYDERLNTIVRTECEDFARVYQQKMNGMVEKRMRGAIHAIASAWYTAWVDAGQPTMEEVSLSQEELNWNSVQNETLKEGNDKKFSIRKHE